MDPNPIYCLMTSGISLTDKLRTHLYALGCKMLKQKKCRVSLKCTDGEGTVSTEGKKALIASGLSGTVFDATVENEDGTGRVRFIIRQCDADSFTPTIFVGFRSSTDSVTLIKKDRSS